ncbi:type 4a pilus biogenesis protein PilO [Oceanimonas baumannii]|uniref:Pilus assembly protein PilP n=1 Tax=Oceanimonas baumannii TaxID=129578 RepID=A0A235CLE0_9GAMM|nr:type 4a pilus biogenesis protein PilO [Oceanimonas baumannii]OYD25408.1 pilus assembly protein PilP [Oceanimonas baumannii]TDW61400.1 type IV pilus assembly protein PilO [Oceanimonas baumannii]
MNWQELNLSELDIEHIGQWPGPVRAFTIVLACLLLAGAGWQFMLSSSQAQLEQARAQEGNLKRMFETKSAQAAALPAYEKQLNALQARLENELRKLPSQLEVAGLLDDISFIATGNGLRIERINWETEQPGPFSTELPMRIIVSGNYHQLGRFVADVAALPRIVILDSFSLSQKGNEQLSMSMLAKTYKYNGQEVQ